MNGPRIAVAIAWATVWTGACGSDDGTPPQGGSSSSSVGTSVSTVSSGAGVSSSGSTASTTDGSSSTTANSTSTTDPSTTSTSSPSCDEPATTGNAETGTMGFEFSETSYCDYMQIDRVGFPLVTTLLVTSVAQYNAADADETINAWVSEINSTFFDLHPDLDAEIQSNGLTPSDFQTYNEQITPLMIPDTLKLDPDAADAFPNGRRLEEPTLDLVLAVLLLDLSVDPIDALANLPLGPTSNDVVLPGTWPYVAGPQ